MNYWIAKTDPEAYSWDDFEKDNTTIWDGVRNYQARNNLSAMKLNDIVLIYHSQSTKDIVGEVFVSKEAFQDPKTDDVKWVAVELTRKRKYSRTLTLESIKSIPELCNLPLIKHTRLSVMPITIEEYLKIIELTN